jgi:hypothetical protein
MRYCDNVSDGLLFVSHKDRQVSFHGYQLDLDEVENAIAQNLPMKGDVVVDTTQSRIPQREELVAFVLLPLLPLWTTSDSDTLVAGDHAGILK